MVHLVFKHGQELDAPVDASILLPSTLLAGMLEEELGKWKLTVGGWVGGFMAG